ALAHERRRARVLDRRRPRRSMAPRVAPPRSSVEAALGVSRGHPLAPRSDRRRPRRPRSAARAPRLAVARAQQAARDRDVDRLAQAPPRERDPRAPRADAGSMLLASARPAPEARVAAAMLLDVAPILARARRERAARALRVTRARVH